MKCPNCNDRNIGKIAEYHFYCWNCFVELLTVKDKLTVYQVEADGSLSSLNDLFCDEELSIE